MTPLGDRIQIRFTWRGKDLRPTLEMKPTAANLRHAARIRETIIAEAKAGTLNLANYFPHYKFSDRHGDPDTGGRTFTEWADLWGNLSVRALEHSTLQVYKNHLAAYWTALFGAELPKAITHERILKHLAQLASERVDEKTGRSLKPLSRKTQNNIMIPLRGVFELICKADPYVQNPTDGIDNLKVQKAPPDPFSQEEVESILAELRRHHGEVLADFFEFSFFAGLRPSEQIALLWQDVDLTSQTVKVRRARVLARDKERTKTNYQRVVELNDRAAAVIDRQRSRTQLAGDHVFRNPATGRPWNDGQEQRREWVIALRAAKVRYRPPKECRDTSVTLALMAGADPYYVAKQHGHSVVTMERDYASWIPKADRGRNLQAVNQSLKNHGFRSKPAVANTNRERKKQ